MLNSAKSDENFKAFKLVFTIELFFYVMTKLNINDCNWDVCFYISYVIAVHSFIHTFLGNKSSFIRENYINSSTQSEIV